MQRSWPYKRLGSMHSPLRCSSFLASPPVQAGYLHNCPLRGGVFAYLVLGQWSWKTGYGGCCYVGGLLGEIAWVRWWKEWAPRHIPIGKYRDPPRKGLWASWLSAGNRDLLLELCGWAILLRLCDVVGDTPGCWTKLQAAGQDPEGCSRSGTCQMEGREGVTGDISPVLSALVKFPLRHSCK